MGSGEVRWVKVRSRITVNIELMISSRETDDLSYRIYKVEISLKWMKLDKLLTWELV